ncbi:DUF1934 family protein [Lactobacillus sp. S2-2]|uniref:DUF1934 domain-containing protein n=1 Tax=Lactobacillus sp. S2-2 TaxID=2692917 RepID=UPI001F485147|nr:DUF1934 domain-containing protein [Lactobacillus sp. S2-2]MCF6515861.1 DUF1934 family protein [Lactobacillus sp. S2-2]
MSSEARKNVQIKMNTEITQEGEIENFSFDEPGKISYVNQQIYVSFYEHSDNKSILVTLKINEDKTIVLTRNAEQRLRVTFDKNNEVDNLYRTEYGPIQLQTTTKRLDYKVADDLSNGEVSIDYDLSNGEQLFGEYKLRLQFFV